MLILCKIKKNILKTIFKLILAIRNIFSKNYIFLVLSIIRKTVITIL